jgi:Cof subfamily protein (haloacid dehalogenase superfamily)
MYKLLAIDMDGTLLNSQEIISEKTISAINQCLKKDVKVIIATGRPIQGVMKYYDSLSVDNLVITYNGAKIFDVLENTTLFSRDLEALDSQAIIDLAVKKQYSFILWSGNKLYTNIINDKVLEYYRLSRVNPIVLEDFSEVIAQGITKIIWIDSPEKVKEHLPLAKKRFGERVSVTISRPEFLEFFTKGISKASAIEFIACKYQIKQEEVIAVGDALNDIEMIKYAGLGVAMGNANEEVKSVADYVCKSNDEDGLVEVIEKFIL